MKKWHLVCGDKDAYLNAEKGALETGRNVCIERLRSKISDQFGVDFLRWDSMRAERDLGKIDQEIPFAERAMIRNEIIKNLRRTRGGVQFLSQSLQTIRAELEKTGSLSEHARDFMLDCFGTEWVYIIPTEACRAGTKFDLDALKTLQTAMDGLASDLRDQGDYVEARDAAERESEILKTYLPSEREINMFIRCEAHFERQYYRALAELERRQARRKGEAVLPRIRVQLE